MHTFRGATCKLQLQFWFSKPLKQPHHGVEEEGSATLDPKLIARLLDSALIELNVRICFFHNISFTFIYCIVPSSINLQVSYYFYFVALDPEWLTRQYCWLQRQHQTLNSKLLWVVRIILSMPKFTPVNSFWLWYRWYHIFLISFWDLISFHDFNLFVPFPDVTLALTDIAGVACTCVAASCGPSSQCCASGTGGTGTSFPCPSKPLWARTIVRSLTRKWRCISTCWKRMSPCHWSDFRLHRSTQYV